MCVYELTCDRVHNYAKATLCVDAHSSYTSLPAPNDLTLSTRVDMWEADAVSSSSSLHSARTYELTQLARVLATDSIQLGRHHSPEAPVCLREEISAIL